MSDTDRARDRIAGLEAEVRQLRADSKAMAEVVLAHLTRVPAGFDERESLQDVEAVLGPIAAERPGDSASPDGFGGPHFSLSS